MIAKVCFLVAFATGLGLAVYSMLHGLERPKGSTPHHPSLVFNMPAVSVFSVILGAVGYLLITRTSVGIYTAVVTGVICGATATAGAIVLLARWAFLYTGNHADDERIQGLLARVTRPISPSNPGQIAFQADGISHTLAAESIQGMEIPRDAEVVIDTIRDGVARVEPWSVVEQRL